MHTLKDLQVGDKAKIISFAACDAHYRQKLIAMGLLPGSIIELTCIAPLGDPIQVCSRGSLVSIRKNEAGILNLEKLHP